MAVIKLIIGSLTWFLVLIFSLVPVIFLVVYKGIVTLLAVVFRSDLYLLSSGDAAVVGGVTKEKPGLNFGTLCVIQGQIDIIELRKKVDSCFLAPKDARNLHEPKYPRMFSRIDTFGGYVFLKRLPSVNLDDVVVQESLKEGEILEDFAARWILEGFDDNTPSWKMVLVKINDADTVFGFKINHVLADGYSLLHILDTLTDNTSPYLVKDFTDSVWKQTKQLIESPCHLKLMNGHPANNPFKCVIRQTKNPKEIWMMEFITFDLQTLKAIRQSQNVHFSSIILTIISGAIRKYILETKTEVDLPDTVGAAATLPWPRHPTKDPSSLQNLCNHWVVGIERIPLRSDNLLENLHFIEKYSQQFQDAGLNKFAKRVLVPLFGIFPLAAMEGMVALDPGFTTGVTSLVGGDNYCLLGKPITRILPGLAIPNSSPLAPMSCFTFSHSGKVEMTVGVNPQWFPDHAAMKRLTTYMREEVSRLCMQCQLESQG